MSVCRLTLRLLSGGSASSAPVSCALDGVASLLWGGMATVTWLSLSATARVRKAPSGGEGKVRWGRDTSGGRERWGLGNGGVGGVGRAVARVEATAAEIYL